MLNKMESAKLGVQVLLKRDFCSALYYFLLAFTLGKWFKLPELQFPYLWGEKMVEIIPKHFVRI